MIAENLKEIRRKITDSCRKYGRNPAEVKLVGVSKVFPVPVLQEAYRAGLRIFGENKAQELRDKSKELPADIEWHFIGRLQSNKIKYVAGKAVLIHSVDSAELAEAVNRHAEKNGISQDILLEVNTSGEDSKIGIWQEEELYRVALEAAAMPALNLKGLMTIGPNTDDEDKIREAFMNLRMYRDRLRESGMPVTELSMGMTQDYDIAIEQGATIIRIGTAIFGERVYH